MKRILLSFAAVWICVLTLCGCDPVLPKTGISVTLTPSEVTVGDEIAVTVRYPDTDGTAVARWSGQELVVVEGNAELTGEMTFRALSPGEIRILVKATAECDFLGVTADSVEYSAELTVTAREKEN